MLKIIWAEDIEPAFTEEQKEIYRELKMQQVYPIGNINNGKRLFHGIGNKETIDNILEFIAFKNPLIVKVVNENNIEYGYNEIITPAEYDDQGEIIQEETREIIRDEELEIYSNEINESLFFEEIEIKNEEGNIEMKVPSNHNFAGWK